MVKGGDGETCCRLLLLETTLGSLDKARLARPAEEVSKCALDETQGAFAQISREKFPIVFNDLSGKGCSTLNVLSQTRRIHLQHPFVVIPLEKASSSGLSAFCMATADVLFHPLDKDPLLVCREILQRREQEEASFARTQQEPNRSFDQQLLQSITCQATLAIENMKLVGPLPGRKAEPEQAHEGLVKVHQDRPCFVYNLSDEMKAILTPVLAFSGLRHAGLSYVRCKMEFFFNLMMKRGLQSAFFCQPEWS